MQLSFTNISYSYEDSPELALGPVIATFPKGWTGIVGNNGSGKTTLLRLACGLLSPKSGSITPRIAGVYCAQETELRPASTDDFVMDFSTEALRIRSLLGIEDDWAWHYDTLSEGQRKRLQVAVALWQDPQLLALDEPTNHVDAPTRSLLLAALAGFRGIGLLVSHDREMLDALVQQCLFLSSGSAIMRPGIYSQGCEQAELELLSAKRERKAAKSELARLSSVKTARDNEAARADSQRSKRHIDKGDRDAKVRIDLAIHTGQDGKAGRRSAQLDARLASAQQRLQAAHVDKTYACSVWLDAQPSKRRLLVELAEGFLVFGSGERFNPENSERLELGSGERLELGSGERLELAQGCPAFGSGERLDLAQGCPAFGSGERLELGSGESLELVQGHRAFGSGERLELAQGCPAFGSGERPITAPSTPSTPSTPNTPSHSGLRIPQLQLGPTDHIAITGANGTGKTTLIRALMQVLGATDLRVLYVPQELSTSERHALLKQLNKLPVSQRGQALSIVAQLNSDPERLLDGCTISPGEARKLMLALGVLSSPEVIVMDEPTNHLDLASTEALERMLAACPCAMLLVSHDSRFLLSVTDIRWHIERHEAGSVLLVS